MEVAIVGAGLLGRLIGWQLTSQGRSVTLFERSARDAPQSAAHVAAAMLAPLSELPESGPELFAAGRRALDLWPPLLDALGVPYGMDGSLLVAHGPDAPLLDKFHRSLGANAAFAAWQDGDGVGALEPALAGRFRRGLLLPLEGWLDNRALLAALESRGGAIQFETPVAPEQLVVERGRARLDADLVIDCRGAGADFADLRGVRGEAVRLHAPEVTLTRPVRLMHPRYQLYVAPRRHGRYVVGATQIESASERPVSVRSALELLSAAFALHPAFAEADIEELSSGLRPAYPDNAPRIEWHGNVLRINGLYRHGFLLAPTIVEQALSMIERRFGDRRPAQRASARAAHGDSWTSSATATL